MSLYILHNLYTNYVYIGYRGFFYFAQSTYIPLTVERLANGYMGKGRFRKTEVVA